MKPSTGGLGFEPRQKAPEAFVLPLHHPPTEWFDEGGIIGGIKERAKKKYVQKTGRDLSTASLN